MSAHTSIGRVVSISTDGTTYNAIGKITKYTYSGSKANYADTTNSSSPVADGSNAVAVERIPTTLDAGTFTISVVADPADTGLTAALAAYQSQVLLYVKDMDKATGAQTSGPGRSYRAYVSKAPIPDGSITAADTYDVEFTITGLITLVPAVTGS